MKKQKRTKGAKTVSKNQLNGGVNLQCIAMALVAIAYLLWFGDKPRQSQKDNNLSPTKMDRLLHYWPMGDNVAIQTLPSSSSNHDDSNNRGLVATRTIRKGQVVLTADYTDLGGDLALLEPNLRPSLQRALQEAIHEQQATFVNLASCTANIMGTLRFLQLVDVYQDPKWLAYADTLPKNVTQMAWYWTPEERTCVVPRPNDQQSPQLRSVFHAVMAKLTDTSEVVRQVYANNPQRAEWAYLMMKTRGFGEFYLIPGLDMANHNPLHAAPPFLFVLPDGRKKVYLIAARDIPPQHPVYNTYGPLTTVKAAEFYGFVPNETEAAYFESPSIHRALLESPQTRHVSQCNGESMRFFGSHVGDQLVEARYAGHVQSTRFKALVPTNATYGCLERLLSSSSSSMSVAQYVADMLRNDYQQYRDRAQDEACQSDEGNVPLIRHTNQVTAQLLFEAYQYAERAANDGTIEYPGF